MTLFEMLNEMKSAFNAADIELPAYEAKALLTGLLGFSNLDVATRQELLLSEDQVKQLRVATEKRLSGMPVYRILGWREFYGLRFELSDGTLEPRADTETLVDAILPYLQSAVSKHPGCKLIDLGTGTGAIALSLLHNCEDVVGLGVDQSEDALVTASGNAKKLGLADRFSTLQSDWVSKVEGQYDIVVSNPPYITKDDLAELSVEVSEHDPLLALDGGDDGLAAYRILARDIPDILQPNGVVGLEFGWNQAESVTEIFQNNGFTKLSLHQDLGGHDRVLLFRYD